MMRMENSWIGKRTRKGRRSPLHDVDSWNYYDQLLETRQEECPVSLTNNMIEGLNSAFAPNVPKNATVWSVVLAFQKEEMLTRLKYTEALRGEVQSHNKSRRKLQCERMQSLATTCANYLDFPSNEKYMDALVRHFSSGVVIGE